MLVQPGLEKEQIGKATRSAGECALKSCSGTESNPFLDQQLTQASGVEASLKRIDGCRRMTRPLVIWALMTCAVLEFMAAVGAVGSAATAPSSAPNSPFQAPTPTTDSKAQDQFEALFRDAQHDFDRGDYAGAARKYERAAAAAD